MDERLLRSLSAVTDEERRLLQGGQIEQERYTSGPAFRVDSAKLLEKGKLISIRPHTRFAPFPLHSHNYIEIMYMCSGKTVHTITGNPPVTLRAGELLFLSQHASHAIQRAEIGDVAVNFIVLPQFFDVALDMIGADNVLGSFLLNSLRRGGGGAGYLHFKVEGVPPVQNLMENLIWSIVSRQPNARRINQTTMGLLLLQLLNYTELLDVPEQSQNYNATAMTALREIEENYSTACLSDVARAQGVSAPYLSQAVQKMTGSTFKLLLRQKRIAKAAQLLRETRLPVQDIIAAVGYDNTSYFHRIFKEEFGMSPKEYRQK